MTVNTTSITSGPYAGNGAGDTFNYDWKITAKTQVIVYETDDLGVETTLTVDTDYTVNGVGNEGGGTITRNAGALPTGYTWYIRSNFQLTQLTDLQSQGAFYPEVHEDALDKLTFIAQQQQDLIDRALKLNDGDTSGAATDLPAPSADRTIVWNSTADALENGPTTTEIANAQSYAIAAGNSATAASTSETNAATSESNAATSESNAATSEANAEAAWDSFDDRYLGPKASPPTLDNDGNPLLEGALYWSSTQNSMFVYDGADWVTVAKYSNITSTEITATAAQTVFVTHGYTAGFEFVYLNGSRLGSADYATTNSTTITLTTGATAGDLFEIVSFEAIATPDNAPNIPSRQGVLNQEAVSQGTSTRTGFSATKYTGNGTSQSISTGVDMATGDFGGMIWTKNRDGVYDHFIEDTVRGANVHLRTNKTNAEAAGVKSSFNSDGFTISGNSGDNINLDNCIAWSWQTNQKATGVTNRNKAYTCHYNTDLGFSIVGYEASGSEGDEIPTHLAKEAELTITKRRDGAGTEYWVVSSPLIGDTKMLRLNDITALEDMV